MQIVTRKFNPSQDAGLIYSSYPKGVYYGSHTPINPKDDYKVKSKWFKEFYLKVKDQLASSTILIACPTDDQSTILGYAIITGTTLEFVYTKELFRNQGIATLLLKNQPIEEYRHITKVGWAILHKEGNKYGKQEAGTNPGSEHPTP